MSGSRDYIHIGILLYVEVCLLKPSGSSSRLFQFIGQHGNQHLNRVPHNGLIHVLKVNQNTASTVQPIYDFLRASFFIGEQRF